VAGDDVAPAEEREKDGQREEGEEERGFCARGGHGGGMSNGKSQMSNVGGSEKRELTSEKVCGGAACATTHAHLRDVLPHSGQRSGVARRS
jgi:hypothetical protein